MRHFYISPTWVRVWKQSLYQSVSSTNATSDYNASIFMCAYFFVNDNSVMIPGKPSLCCLHFYGHGNSTFEYIKDFLMGNINCNLNDSSSIVCFILGRVKSSKMRSITHPKILFLNTLLPSTAQHWKSIYFLALLSYHCTGGFFFFGKFPFRYEAIRHISIIKAKKKFEFLFVIISIFIEKYFSALVMSFHHRTRDIIVVVGVARETIWFRLYTKGGVRWVRGRLFYPYLSIIFNISTSRDYCLYGIHIRDDDQEEADFPIDFKLSFLSFINFFPLLTSWKFIFLFCERCTIWLRGVRGEGGWHLST